MALPEAFEHYIKENGLLAPDDRVLLTVSGGVDSDRKSVV